MVRLIRVDSSQPGYLSTTLGPMAGRSPSDGLLVNHTRGNAIRACRSNRRRPRSRRRTLTSGWLDDESIDVVPTTVGAIIVDT